MDIALFAPDSKLINIPVETLRSFGIDPFAMPYDKTDPYQKAFSRWVNHKAIFKSVKWEEYRKG